MITPRESTLTRIFRDLVQDSRTDGQIRRAQLRGGAELVVWVRDGWITLTIKRLGRPVGQGEIGTFQAHCGVPLDATQLTPIDAAGQPTRAIGDVTWYYVAFRWPEV